jgi:glycosyltransferase involved in cell wall biosynthesis
VITVVIPTFNEGKFIGILLESLAIQTVPEDLEIVVADNRSVDDTCIVAERFRARFARLLIVEGGTPAVGRNKGAAASSGNPIFFIDADVRLVDRVLIAKSVLYFRSRHLAVATIRLQPRSRRWVDQLMVGAYNLLLWPAMFVRPMGSMCIVADRSAFEAVGGYPEDVAMAEDHDFVLRCAKTGRYRIIPGRAEFNVRRLEKEGRFNLLRKYIHVTLVRLWRGPVTEFRYDFGCFTHDLESPSD